jgi:hypothetical protein
MQSGLIFMCDAALETCQRSNLRVDLILVRSPSAADHAPPRKWNMQYCVPIEPTLF